MIVVMSFMASEGSFGCISYQCPRPLFPTGFETQDIDLSALYLSSIYYLIYINSVALICDFVPIGHPSDARRDITPNTTCHPK